MGIPPAYEPPIWEEDLSIEPLAYKVYTTLPAVPLPSDLLETSMPALEAIARSGSPWQSERDGSTPPLNRTTIAHLARLSNGLLHRQRRRRTGRMVEFRTAGATGGRYHLEQYYVCGNLPDLDAGVYHYDSQAHCLRQLRAGDFRGAIVDATGSEPNVAEAPVVMAMTSTFWRNAWRYRARAYRHAFWDAGTSLANFICTAASLRIPSKVLLGFADAAINRLVGADGEREAAIVICSLGEGDPAPAVPASIEPIRHPTQPLSHSEVTFADIPLMHAASSLGSGDEAAAWRARPLARALPPLPSDSISLNPIAQGALPTAPTEAVILGRRSRRVYDTAHPLGFREFSTILARSSCGLVADYLETGSLPLNDNYVIVNDVAGVPAGTYLHRQDAAALEPLRRGTFRSDAAHLAFDQPYAGEAHANSYYLADLGSILDTYGNRGYRVAQLEAALYAGRLHLAAEALGLGAVGTTSFDEQVVEFFSPRAANASYMFVTAFGLPLRRT